MKPTDIPTSEQIVELFDEDDESIEVIECGDWTDEHKHQYRTDIVKHSPSGTFWSIDMSRSGSYWSDYEYEPSEPSASSRKRRPSPARSTRW